MPLLARAKRRVATALSSAALAADSRQTDLCAYLSAILLVGLVLNALVGWWWADPVAGLAMVPVARARGCLTFTGQGGLPALPRETPGAKASNRILHSRRR